MNKKLKKLCVYPIKGILIAVVGIVFLQAAVYAVERVVVSDFAGQGMELWKPHEFKGLTEYQVVEIDGKTAVKAESKGSASAIIREMNVDLKKTPYLNWSWKINRVQPIEDERIKAGDDFSARVYVIIKNSFLIWRTKALNYVWSSGQTRGSIWDNPFTDNVKMLAVESGNNLAGNWVSEKRNVREDLKTAFGYDFDEINGIAIMTDTDNSGGNAVTYYGELVFTSE